MSSPFITSNGTPFDQHLVNCPCCKDNIFNPCQEGREVLRSSNESGQASEFDRILYKETDNGRQY